MTSEVLAEAMRLQAEALPDTTGTVGNGWQASKPLESRTSHSQAPPTTVPLDSHTPYQKENALKALNKKLLQLCCVQLKFTSRTLEQALQTEQLQLCCTQLKFTTPTLQQALQTEQLASLEGVPSVVAESLGPWTLCEMPCSWPKHRSLHQNTDDNNSQAQQCVFSTT